MREQPLDRRQPLLLRGRARARPRRVEWLLFAVLALALLIHARAAQADDPARLVEARALFEQGVQKSAAGEYADAALLFERSRELAERPATVLNLLLVYERLEQPLRVVPLVQRLLQISDPVRHEGERKEALALEARAYARLGRVVLERSPREALVTVDGEPAVIVHDQLLLTPGEHTLQIVAPGHAPERDKVRVEAGERVQRGYRLSALPEPVADVVAVAAPPPAVTLERPRTKRLTRTAYALVGLGMASWASGVVVQGVATHVARDLEHHSPYRDGYIRLHGKYQVLYPRSVSALAASGGGVATAGALLSVLTRRGRPKRRGLALALALTGVAAAAAGTVIVIRAPEQLGKHNVNWPTTGIGTLLLSGAVPALTWGFGESLR